MKRQCYSMMNRKREFICLKILFIHFLLFALVPNQGNAQSMFLKRTSGDVVEYPLNKVKKVTYNQDKILISQVNNVIDNYDLNQVNQINFKGYVAGINEETTNQNNLVVYPNPASGPVEIEYQVFGSSPAKLEVIDLSGKVTAIIAEGVLKSGVNKAKWDLSDTNGKQVVSGSYLVRFTQDTKSYTKMVVIQK